MAKKSWSFPTSPRNPAKIPIELGILLELAEKWKEQQKRWEPETTQLEFGEALRASGAETGEDDGENLLYFKKQADTISAQNLAWTARARFGTVELLGFGYINKEGDVELTGAGRRIGTTNRPDIVMLKQLIKWQYPDNQHHGKAYPEKIFHIWPFVAVAQLVKELGGLTKNELELFCFTMIIMKDIPRARKNIADFRVKYANEKGRIPKRKLVVATRHELKEIAQAQGNKLPADSFRHYADALGRYMRYTGIFSIDGNRIVVTKGREQEVEELLKLNFDLYPYAQTDSFYLYYGNPDIPTLATDVNPTILQNQIKEIETNITRLYADLSVLKRGVAIESPVLLPESLPDNIEELRSLLDLLRDAKKKVEFEIIVIRGHWPERLREALDFYDKIINRQTFDDATYLEWNTWRVFLALDRAKKVKPNLILDENLQPINTAAGNGPDIEISYEGFHIVPEVTMRRGTDQSYYETFPVIRHVEDFRRKVNSEETYGLFIAPRCHDDTIHQFFVSWKYAVRSGETTKVIPLTIDQFRNILQPYVTDKEFQPSELRSFFEKIGEILLESQNSVEWHSKFPQIIEDWKRQILGETDEVKVGNILKKDIRGTLF